MKILFPILLSCLFLSLLSCKKEAAKPDITETVMINEGLLRIECSDCDIKYVINKKQFTETVKDGNADLSFSYQVGYNLSTQIISKKDQNIRLLILNSQGQIISNELVSFLNGEVRNDNFDLDTN